VTDQATISILENASCEVQDLAICCGLSDGEECCELKNALVCTPPDGATAIPLAPPITTPSTTPTTTTTPTTHSNQPNLQDYFGQTFGQNFGRTSGQSASGRNSYSFNFFSSSFANRGGSSRHISQSRTYPISTPLIKTHSRIVPRD